MITIKGIEVFSDGGKWVRRKSDGTYFRRATVLKGETADDFEEADAPPDPDVQQTIAEKLRQITDYDTSPAVNSFKLNGADVWLDKATRVGLMNSTAIEKAAGKETTTLWFAIGGVETKITLPCDTAIQMLSALEMYALACYNRTAQHKAAVAKLTTVEEVEAYDFTTGYPEKPAFDTQL